MNSSGLICLVGAAASVPWISGDDRANLGAESVAIAVLVVIMVARLTTMSL